MNKAEMLKKYGLTFADLPFTILTAQHSTAQHSTSYYTVNLQAEITSLSLFPATITDIYGAFRPFHGRDAPFFVPRERAVVVIA